MGWLKIQNLNILKQNIIFLRNKEILNLCFRWHILRSYCFVVEVTFKSFYPFITWGLINKAIEFAKTIVDVPDEDINYHAVMKNLIVSRKSTMSKKGKRQKF